MRGDTGKWNNMTYNLKIQALWSTVLLLATYLISLGLLMYKVLFQVSVAKQQIIPKLGGSKWVIISPGSVGWLGKAEQFSLGSLNSCRQMLAWGCSHLKTSLSWIFRLTYTYGRHQMLAVGRLSTVAIFRGLGSQGMDARSQGGACQAQGSRGPDASNKVKVSYELTLKVHTYDFSNILLTKLVTQDSPDLKGGKLYYLWSSDIVSKAFSKDFFFFF